MATAGSSRGKSGGGKADVESRPCPASCGYTISGKDPHPLCIMCMGVKHAKEALADRSSCDHCRPMAPRIVQRRLRVAAASKANPCLSEAGTQPSAKSGGGTGAAGMHWGDSVELESPVEEFPPLFDQLLDGEDVGGEDEEEDMNLQPKY